MGVTIHFEGHLKNQKSYEDLINKAREFGQTNSWKTELIKAERVMLRRFRDEKPWDYVGPAQGIILYPHDDCDPVRLEFDKDLYLQEYTKTQFAGEEIHKKVVALLHEIEPFFENLTIVDEGEFWETQDDELLNNCMSSFYRALEDELQKYPEAKIKVKTPDGRIIDMII